MRAIVPPGMEHFPVQSGYAPGMVAGGLLFMAGQLGRDDAMQVIADPEAQITRAWQNVLTILHHAGASVTDLVDVTTFHVGLREHLPLYRQVRDRFMAGHTPPWTAIGVSELSRPGLIVEIKCVARMPGE
ncbi:MAG: RidA family protein [Rhodospirillales bacterium]|jgi:enamine deaminase RidA (YjgF/YER057c/UK114 family)|nr:RidA family protein [Alphaproteobacteria bacterium]NDG49194.1 RidA family protein [Rhodospirillales bacterium]